MSNMVLGALFIFFARVTDVSMGTLRTLFIVRGKRFHAAVLGFFEVIIYIVALNRVVNALDNPVNLIVYALGFATGNYVGSFLEEKMALGNISAQIICSKSMEMANALRDVDFGVTVLDGLGKEGEKEILLISLRRKYLPRLLDIAEDIDHDCFITVTDARTTRGGYFKGRKGK